MILILLLWEFVKFTNSWVWIVQISAWLDKNFEFFFIIIIILGQLPFCCSLYIWKSYSLSASDYFSCINIPEKHFRIVTPWGKDTIIYQGNFLGLSCPSRPMWFAKKISFEGCNFCKHLFLKKDEIVKINECLSLYQPNLELKSLWKY